MTEVAETVAPVVTTEATKITSEKPVKLKDPKRVAQGKKLAEISKQAKERKRRERIEAEMQEGEVWNIPLGYVVGAIGLGVVAGALYYGYCPKVVPTVWESRSGCFVLRVLTTSRFNNLETFD